MDRNSGLSDGNIGFLTIVILGLAVSLAFTLTKVDELRSENAKLKGQMEVLTLQLSNDR